MGRPWLLTILAACSFAPHPPGNAQAIDAPIGGQPDAAGSDGSPPPPDGPPPAVTFVRSVSAFSTPWSASASSVGVTLAADAGDTLAVYFTFDGHASLSNVTDDQGDTFVVVDTGKDTDHNQVSVTAYAANVHGGTTKVTAKLSQSVCCRIGIGEELHGADPAAPLDTHSKVYQSSVATGADGAQATAITTAAAGELVFAATTDPASINGLVIASGTLATLRENVSEPTDSGNAASSEDQAAAAPGAVTPTFTYSKSGGSAVTLVLAFKP